VFQSATQYLLSGSLKITIIVPLLVKNFRVSVMYPNIIIFTFGRDDYFRASEVTQRRKT